MKQDTDRTQSQTNQDNKVVVSQSTEDIEMICEDSFDLEVKSWIEQLSDGDFSHDKVRLIEHILDPKQRAKNLGQLSILQKRQLCEPILKRVFRFGNENLQEKATNLLDTILCSLIINPCSHQQINQNQVEEKKMRIADIWGSTEPQPLDGASFDLIETILDEEHPIFNFRLSRNNNLLMQSLSNLRNPDSEQRNKEEISLIEGLSQQNGVLFSHIRAHLILSFGRVNGFLRLIAHPQSIRNLSHLRKLIKIFQSCKDFISVSEWSKILESLDHSVHTFFSKGVSNDLRRLTRKEFIDFADKLEYFLIIGFKKLIPPNSDGSSEQKEQKSQNQIKISHTLASIHLAFALQCLKLPVLEKKLQGEQLLNLKVVHVQQQQVLSEQQGRVGSGQWLDEKILADWMEANNIFSLFFGGSMHTEVIKKSYPILAFLYKNGRLGEKELQKMWHMATKKHEAFRVSIVRAITFLASRMQPRELEFCFKKLQGIPLREHDKFSLGLLKGIAKRLAPEDVNEHNKLRKAQQNERTSNLIDQIDRKLKHKAQDMSLGSEQPNKVARQEGKRVAFDEMALDGLTSKRTDNLFEDFDDVGENQSKIAKKSSLKRRGSDSCLQPRVNLQNLNGGDPIPLQNDKNDEQFDQDMQKAIQFSMQQQESDNTEVRQQNSQIIKEYLPKAEDLLEVPLDKQSKNTADAEFSPPNSSREISPRQSQTVNFQDSTQIDVPMKMNQSPKKDIKIFTDQEESKLTQNDIKEESFTGKPAITDFFYEDRSLGFKPEIAIDSQNEIYRQQLSKRVLHYMWLLCLEDSAFEANLSEYGVQGQERYVNGLSQGIGVQNVITNINRAKKGLSMQMHQFCIEQFCEMLNYNFPIVWFNKIKECSVLMRRNQHPLTMQIIIKKLLLGAQFPLLQNPSPPTSNSATKKVENDLNFRENSFDQNQNDQQLLNEKIRALPQNRLDLLKTLEDELELTGSCLCGYIQFKQDSLQLIYAHNFGNAQEEDDNMETQSSLDTTDQEDRGILSQSTTTLITNNQVQQSVTNGIMQQSSMGGAIPNHDQLVSQNSRLQQRGRLPSEEQRETKMSGNEVIIGNSMQSQMATADEEVKERSSIKENGGSTSTLAGASGLQNNNGSSRFGATLRTGNDREGNRSFLDTMVTNRVYNFSFQREMTERMDFLRFLVSQRPDTILRPEHIQLLWECLVNNAFYERERDMFFIWCTEVLQAARRMHQMRPCTAKVLDDEKDFFSDDCLELIFFDRMLKLDVRFFTDSIYTCFEQFFVHTNEQYGQIVSMHSLLEVFEYKLIGSEALQEIVLQVRDNKVYERVTSFYMRLLRSLDKEVLSKNLAEIRLDLLQTCTQHVRTGLENLQSISQQNQNNPWFDPENANNNEGMQSVSQQDHVNRVSRSIDLLARFIEQFECGPQASKEAEKSRMELMMAANDPEIRVIVNNQVSLTEGPSKIDLNLKVNSTTIKYLQEQLAATIQPTRPVNELFLTYKGKELKEPLKSLKQVMGSQFGNVQQIVMILSSKTAIEMEYENQNAAIFGVKTGENDIDLNLLRENVAQVKMFLGTVECSDEVIELALKKCSMNLEDAIGLVITEESISELQAEVAAKNELQKQSEVVQVPDKFEEEAFEENIDEMDDQRREIRNLKLMTILGNKSEYFDLLFDLLNLGVADITSSVWNLLMQIPVNQNLLERMKSIRSVNNRDELLISDEQNPQNIQQVYHDIWRSLIQPNSTYKMLYSLQILNTLVSVTTRQIGVSDSETIDSNDWRQRFLQTGGFTHLYTILISTDILDKANSTDSQISQKSKQLQLQTSKVSKKQQKKLQRAENGPQKINQQSPSRERLDQARCLSFLISILKIFIQAALLTVSQETLLSLIMQSSTSPFLGTKKQGGRQEDQSINKNPPVVEQQMLLQNLASKASGIQQNQNSQQLSRGEASFSSDTSADNKTDGAGTPKWGSEKGAGNSPQSFGGAVEKNQQDFGSRTKEVAQKQHGNMDQQSDTSVQSAYHHPKNTFTQVDDFPRLVEQMKQNGMAQMLLDQVIDLTELVHKLLQIVHSTILYQSSVEQSQVNTKSTTYSTTNHEKQKSEMTTENANKDDIAIEELLQHTLDLLLPCIIWQPNLLLREISEFQNLESLLVKGLSLRGCPGARKAISRTFRLICTTQIPRYECSLSLNGVQSPPCMQILKILIKNLHIVNENTQTGDPHFFYDEYINLVAALIKASKDQFEIVGGLQEKDGDNQWAKQPGKNQQIKKSQAIDVNELFVEKQASEQSGETQIKLRADLLLDKFIESITQRSVVEDRGSVDPNWVLCSYLYLTQSLLECGYVSLKQHAGNQQNNLVKMLFTSLFSRSHKAKTGSSQRQTSTLQNLLSDQNEEKRDNQPNFKTKLTRKRAFNLLLQLCQKCPQNYTQLIGRLFKAQKQVQSAKQVIAKEQLSELIQAVQIELKQQATGSKSQANLSTKAVTLGVRAASGYVGLRNFGCTCYMNSLIQQLFMIPDLRSGILKANLGEMDFVHVDHNKQVLKELQNTFAHLQESEKKFFAPHGFTKAFKFYGEPINVREQQDSHEFFNVLCDNIENSSPQSASLLKRCLGGTLVNETKSLEKNYAYVGENEEPFFTLTLDIKNKKTIQEALDLYVRPDILEGDNKYFCEKHERHIEAQRRTYIRDLAKTVVVNLKRFEFDFNTQTRSKINDYCEFPQYIDFTPWTKEGIEKTEKALKKKKRNAEFVDSGREAGQEAVDEEIEEEDGEEDIMMSYEIMDEEIVDEHIFGEEGGQACGRFSENDEIESSDNEEDNDGRPIQLSMDIDEEEEEMEEGYPDELNDNGTGFEDLLITETQEDEENPQNLTLSKKQSEQNSLATSTNLASKKLLNLHKHELNKQASLNLTDLNQAKRNRQRSKEAQQIENLYKLVGVLVHSGSANSGHYYSYIRERNEQGRWLEFNDTTVKEFDFAELAKECFGTPPEKKSADPNSRPTAFSQWETHRNAYLLVYERVEIDQKKSSVQQVDVTEKQLMPLQDNEDVIMTDATELQSQQRQKLINDMPAVLYEQINAQNEAFMCLNLHYDHEYFQFLRELYCLFQDTFGSLSGAGSQTAEHLYTDRCDSDTKFHREMLALTEKFRVKNLECLDKFTPEMTFFAKQYERIVAEFGSEMNDLAPENMLQESDFSSNMREAIIVSGVAISLDIAQNLKDVNSFVKWVQLLDPLLARSAQACLWLLKYFTHQKGIIAELLLENPKFEVRESFLNLLKTAVDVTAKNEETYFFEKNTYLEFTGNNLSSENLRAITVDKAAVIRFMKFFFGELFEGKLRKNLSQIEEYFILLKDFAQSSFQATKWLILEQQAIYRLIEFLGTNSSNQPFMTQVIDLLSYLVRSTITQGIKASDRLPQTAIFQDQQKQIEIPTQEIGFLLKTETMRDLIAMAGLTQSIDASVAMVTIVQHLSWGDRNVSQFFIQTLVAYLKYLPNAKKTSDGDSLCPELSMTFKVLRGLLELSDSELQKERIMCLLDLEAKFVNSQPFLSLLRLMADRNPKFVLFGLNFIAECALSEPTLQMYLVEHQESITSWISQFLSTHIRDKNSTVRAECSKTLENCFNSFKELLQLDDIQLELALEISALNAQQSLLEGQQNSQQQSSTQQAQQGVVTLLNSSFEANEADVFGDQLQNSSEQLIGTSVGINSGQLRQAAAAPGFGAMIQQNAADEVDSDMELARALQAKDDQDDLFDTNFDTHNQSFN